jgi:hypothetical protein
VSTTCDVTIKIVRMYCRQFFANDDFTMGIMQSKAEA